MTSMRTKGSPAGRSPFIISLLALLSVSIPGALAQTDDFDDGNDDGWTRHNSLSVIPGVSPTYSFPDDGFGGKAYRIQSPAPPIADAGPARAFSNRTNSYTDFFAAVDVIAWDNNLNQAFGFLFRAGNIGLGTTTGYVMNYDPQQSAGGRGQLQINTVAGEQDTGTIGAANISMHPGKRYRLTLNAVGSDLTVRAYDLNDLTRPLATFTANDSTEPSGVVGLFDFYRGSAITDPNAGRADTTFDDYYAASTPPATIAFPATPHPILHMPQVANRSPVSFANFYPAASGISFTATTLTTNLVDTNAARLFLNGADVSSGLVFSGSASNLNVTYNGLKTNSVYDARIVLSDFAGRTSTNEWTFDTFTQSFLSAANARIIEAEDYNYNGGQYQDDPPPSGLNSSSGQVNGNGAGYYNLDGVPDIDFFDRATAPGSGQPPEYRQNDFVGTQAGTMGEVTPGSVVNDTIRQKYAALDLPEYQVRRTEGTEWLNYTRNFPAGVYNVYLRAACRAPQTVNLDRVTSDSTQPNQTASPLGVFNVPSTGIINNYRYVPLTDANGNLSVLTLSGTNTVRLTMGGAATNVTQYTLALNYLAFVPATLPQVVLLSTADVGGMFAANSTATIDTTARTVTVSRAGNTRFYRLQSSAPPAVNITGIRIVGINVVINYQ